MLLLIVMAVTCLVRAGPDWRRRVDVDRLAWCSELHGHAGTRQFPVGGRLPSGAGRSAIFRVPGIYLQPAGHP